jgi:hypothetical protein
MLDTDVCVLRASFSACISGHLGQVTNQLVRVLLLIHMNLNNAASSAAQRVTNAFYIP